MPRNVPGRALIGDARNDENAIVVQVHLLFIKFHNAVLDALPHANTYWEELLRGGAEDRPLALPVARRARFPADRPRARPGQRTAHRRPAGRLPSRRLPLSLRATRVLDGRVPLRPQHHPVSVRPHTKRRHRRRRCGSSRTWMDCARCPQSSCSTGRASSGSRSSGISTSLRTAWRSTPPSSGPLFALPHGGGSLAQRNLDERGSWELRPARRLRTPSGSRSSTTQRCDSRNCRSACASACWRRPRSGTTSSARRSAGRRPPRPGRRSHRGRRDPRAARAATRPPTFTRTTGGRHSASTRRTSSG